MSAYLPSSPGDFLYQRDLILEMNSKDVVVVLLESLNVIVALMKGSWRGAGSWLVLLNLRYQNNVTYDFYRDNYSKHYREGLNWQGSSFHIHIVHSEVPIHHFRIQS